MPRIGGNLFEGVQFPIAFGDRFVSITRDTYNNTLLVDIYRWDRQRDRLVVEMLQGRPLPGAPPITVTPLAGAGAVRLTVAGHDESLVGYLSGGDDPRSLVISTDRIALYRADQVVFEMLSSTIVGLPIGLRLDEAGGTAIGAALPPEFPRRRLFLGATIILTDLVGIPPVIRDVEFEDCRLIGPALIAALGPLELSQSMLPTGHFVWELPASEGEMVGLIGLDNCTIRRCSLEGIGLAVPRGTRDEIISRILSS
jgi:hypothetical protein